MVLEEFSKMTDEQRRAYIENVNLLANLETIRVNQFHILQLHKEKKAGVDTTSETLKTDKFKVGWIYVITSITAYEEGTGTPQIKVGIWDGSVNQILESATVGNAEDTVEYVGQLMLKEGDYVFAEFESATAADHIHLFVNGYKIRR